MTVEPSDALALRTALKDLVTGAPAPPVGAVIRRRVVRRRALTSVVALGMAAAVAFGVIVGTAADTRPSRDVIQPADPPGSNPPLPEGARPLPGRVAVDSLGVLRVLSPGSVSVTREQALAAYDGISGAASRDGRVVKTAVARVAYVDKGQVRTSVLWVVSVWLHPAQVGVSPQHNWCVDYGFVNASTGEQGGHVYGCLPPSGRPTAIH